ncbi:filaggrin-like [Phymastichus coffea]|uniref:filaggrin-like n=1 Tax=Phymastichus coffea TaxID=108790 RepID=UPI00273B823A|nr:filaggrin-like [Phymastichus coffea]
MAIKLVFFALAVFTVLATDENEINQRTGIIKDLHDKLHIQRSHTLYRHREAVERHVGSGHKQGGYQHGKKNGANKKIDYGGLHTGEKKSEKGLNIEMKSGSRHQQSVQIGLNVTAEREANVELQGSSDHQQGGNKHSEINVGLQQNTTTKHQVAGHAESNVTVEGGLKVEQQSGSEPKTIVHQEDNKNGATKKIDGLDKGEEKSEKESKVEIEGSSKRQQAIQVGSNVTAEREVNEKLQGSSGHQQGENKHGKINAELQRNTTTKHQVAGHAELNVTVEGGLKVEQKSGSTVEMIVHQEGNKNGVTKKNDHGGLHDGEVNRDKQLSVEIEGTSKRQQAIQVGLNVTAEREVNEKLQGSSGHQQGENKHGKINAELQRNTTTKHQVAGHAESNVTVEGGHKVEQQSGSEPKTIVHQEDKNGAIKKNDGLHIGEVNREKELSVEIEGSSKRQQAVQVGLNVTAEREANVELQGSSNHQQSGNKHGKINAELQRSTTTKHQVAGHAALNVTVEGELKVEQQSGSTVKTIVHQVGNKNGATKKIDDLDKGEEKSEKESKVEIEGSSKRQQAVQVGLNVTAEREANVELQGSSDHQQSGNKHGKINAELQQNTTTKHQVAGHAESNVTVEGGLKVEQQSGSTDKTIVHQVGNKNGATKKIDGLDKGEEKSEKESKVEIEGSSKRQQAVQVGLNVTAEREANVELQGSSDHQQSGNKHGKINAELQRNTTTKHQVAGHAALNVTVEGELKVEQQSGSTVKTIVHQVGNKNGAIKKIDGLDKGEEKSEMESKVEIEGSSKRQQAVQVGLNVTAEREANVELQGSSDHQQSGNKHGKINAELQQNTTTKHQVAGHAESNVTVEGGLKVEQQSGSTDKTIVHQVGNKNGATKKIDGLDKGEEKSEKESKVEIEGSSKRQQAVQVGLNVTAEREANVELQGSSDHQQSGNKHGKINAELQQNTTTKHQVAGHAESNVTVEGGLKVEQQSGSTDKTIVHQEDNKNGATKKIDGLDKGEEKSEKESKVEIEGSSKRQQAVQVGLNVTAEREANVELQGSSDHQQSGNKHGKINAELQQNTTTKHQVAGHAESNVTVEGGLKVEQQSGSTDKTIVHQEDNKNGATKKIDGLDKGEEKSEKESKVEIEGSSKLQQAVQVGLNVTAEREANVELQGSSDHQQSGNKYGKINAELQQNTTTKHQVAGHAESNVTVEGGLKVEQQSGSTDKTIVHQEGNKNGATKKINGLDKGEEKREKESKVEIEGSSKRQQAVQVGLNVTAEREANVELQGSSDHQQGEKNHGKMNAELQRNTTTKHQVPGHAGLNVTVEGGVNVVSQGSAEYQQGSYGRSKMNSTDKQDDHGKYNVGFDHKGLKIEMKSNSGHQYIGKVALNRTVEGVNVHLQAKTRHHKGEHKESGIHTTFKEGGTSRQQQRNHSVSKIGPYGDHKGLNLESKGGYRYQKHIHQSGHKVGMKDNHSGWNLALERDSRHQQGGHKRHDIPGRLNVGVKEGLNIQSQGNSVHQNWKHQQGKIYGGHQHSGRSKLNVGIESGHRELNVERQGNSRNQRVGHKWNGIHSNLRQDATTRTSGYQQDINKYDGLNIGVRPPHSRSNIKAKGNSRYQQVGQVNLNVKVKDGPNVELQSGFQQKHNKQKNKGINAKLLQEKTTRYHQVGQRVYKVGVKEGQKGLNVKSEGVSRHQKKGNYGRSPLDRANEHQHDGHDEFNVAVEGQNGSKIPLKDSSEY